MPTFGDTTLGGDTAPNTTDRAWVSLATCPEIGVAASISAYFPGTTAGMSWKGLIFANSAGSPGSLLANTSAGVVDTVAGFKTLTISLALTATTYFIGLVCDDFQRDVAIDTGLTGQTYCRKEGYTYTAPPATYGTPDATATDSRLNVYVTYTVGGVRFKQLRPGPFKPGNPWPPTMKLPPFK